MAVAGWGGWGLGRRKTSTGGLMEYLTARKLAGAHDPILLLLAPVESARDTPLRCTATGAP